MSSNSEFYELYRRPEWQKKRLEVMAAAEFMCEECFAKDKTLNVHHRYYKKGAKPWEYDNSAFACLCEECHEERHKLANELKVVLGGLSLGYLEIVLGHAKGLALLEMAPVVDGANISIATWEEALGVACAYLAPAEAGYEIINAVLDSNGVIAEEQVDSICSEFRDRSRQGRR